MCFNEILLYPILSQIFTNNIQVLIPKDNQFAVIIQNIEFDNSVKVKTPFGRWWLIPMCILLCSKSKEMIKRFTIYHFFITLLLPTTIAIIFIDYVWVSSLIKRLYTLELILALLFILIGIKRYIIKSKLDKSSNIISK